MKVLHFIVVFFWVHCRCGLWKRSCWVIVCERFCENPWILLRDCLWEVLWESLDLVERLFVRGLCESLNLVVFMLYVLCFLWWEWSITHPWEGRDAWVKGLVGLTHVVEELSHVWRLIVYVQWMFILLACILGGIRRCVEVCGGEDIMSPKRACWKWEQV